MLKLLLISLLLIFAISSYSQKIRVVENSAIAKILAKIKHEPTYAITFGKTIFISCKKEEFFSQTWWVKHELAHVEQYERYGTIPFLGLYLYYSLFHHKNGNRFEIEAEVAEYSGELTVKGKPTK